MKRRSFDASLTLRVVDYASVIDAVLAAGFSIPKEMEAAASSRGNTVSYAQRLDVPKPAVSLVSFLEIQLYESDTQDSRTTEWPYQILRPATYFAEIDFTDDCFETETLLASKFGTAKRPYQS